MVSQQCAKQVQQQHQQQEQDKEGIRELTLHTLVDKLKVLCDLLVESDNLKANGYDLTGVVKTQEWEF